MVFRDALVTLLCDDFSWVELKIRRHAVMAPPQPREGDVLMNSVRDARSALQSGASTVLSTVQHNTMARRLLPASAQKLVKRLNRNIEPRRSRTLPLVLISVGVSAAATVAGVLVSRYILARRMDEEPGTSMEEQALTGEAVLAD